VIQTVQGMHLEEAAAGGDTPSTPKHASCAAFSCGALAACAHTCMAACVAVDVFALGQLQNLAHWACIPAGWMVTRITCVLPPATLQVMGCGPQVSWVQ
jgi:hypothetical protein